MHRQYRLGDTGGGNAPGLSPGQPADLTSTSPAILVQDEPRGASQLIEVPVTAVGTTKVVLPVIQNLQNQVDINIVIKAFRVIPDSVLPFAPTLGGINAPLAELQKLSLVLYSQEWEKGQLIPLCSLIDIFTEASGIPWRSRTVRFDNWRNVNFGKSYVIYANGTAAVGAPYNILFEAEYTKFNKDGVEIQGPA